MLRVVLSGIFALLILILIWWWTRTEYFYVPVRHSVCDLGREPETSEERKMALHVGKMIWGFLRHLDMHHESDARTLRAMQAWNGRVKILRSRDVSVRFSRNTGCLLINPDVLVTWDENMLINALLRQLAHMTCCAYDSKWLDAYVFYLRIATEELGLKVDVKCSDCKNFGLCYEVMCPKCSWPDCG